MIRSSKDRDKHGLGPRAFGPAASPWPCAWTRPSAISWSTGSRPCRMWR